MNRLLSLILLATFLAGCTLPAPFALPTQPAPTAAFPTPLPPTPLPETMLTFIVTLPAPLQPGETLSLTVLDEVVGLVLNPTRYSLTAQDALTYSTILPFPLGTVLKYRYTRQGPQMLEEYTSDSRPVRYRLYHVVGQAVVRDVVSRWTDTPFSGPTGRITGQVTDSRTGQPIPNLLVTAGGAQTLTTSDGDYLLEGLPAGMHLLVAYALDGAYQTFQQEALIAADSTTPAPLILTSAPLVPVTFVVVVPPGTLAAVPIRMAGNLFQLGNTYADLAGGVNTVAVRMPVLAPLPDGRYTLTINLPAGADVRYRYTLGDGFWNGENDAKGQLRLRQLIVPANATLINELVAGWKSARMAPITFQVTAPASTPANETLSIQFNPGYGWTNPIPMWLVGTNRWMYILYSPLDGITSLGYRYCREDQCGRADDAATQGDHSHGLPATTSPIAPLPLVDEITAWAWLSSTPLPATVPNLTIQARDPAKFMAGIEFQPYYHPTWSTRLPKAIGKVSELRANWLILTPTWTFTRQNLPVLEPVTGRDPLWPDLTAMLATAHQAGLNVALFPTPHFPTSAAEWWQSAPRDFAWWQVWFERYRSFALHHADLAAQQNAQALILGGDWLGPALPGGKLADGSSPNLPEDAEARWRSLLVEVRKHYSGQLLWALPASELASPPAFLETVDQVYLLWSLPLSKQANAPESDMTAEAIRLLKEQVQPFQQIIGKPVILAVSYPSANGGATGCLGSPATGCLDLTLLDQPYASLPNLQLNLAEQTSAYNAVLTALNDQAWVGGFVSRGYYPPAALQDFSTSVHGKPAEGVLWYWFPKLLGK